MKHQQMLIASLFIFFFNSQINAAKFICGKSLVNNVKGVSGNVVRKGEFPWHASIYVSSCHYPDAKYHCGGTLLTSNTILTAAHCVHNSDNELFTPDKVKVHLDEIHLIQTNIQEFEVMIYFKSRFKLLYCWHLIR